MKRAKRSVWIGGDRYDPPRSRWRLYVGDRCLGGVARYEHNGRWSAYLVENGCVTVGTNAHFGRRCAAKRWVEVKSARRRER